MAYCTNCGTQLGEQAYACPQCGHPRAPATPTAPVGAARRTEGTAVAALVLGIAGFVVCPLIPHIAAIILGNQAQTRIRQDPSLDGEGLAKAGVVLGWVGVGLFAVFIGVMVLMFVLAAPFTFIDP